MLAHGREPVSAQCLRFVRAGEAVSRQCLEPFVDATESVRWQCLVRGATRARSILETVC